MGTSLDTHAPALKQVFFIRDGSTLPGTGAVQTLVVAAGATRLFLGATDGIGYLLKERVADIGQLTSAIRTVASGGSAIDPEVVARLAQAA